MRSLLAALSFALILRKVGVLVCHTRLECLIFTWAVLVGSQRIFEILVNWRNGGRMSRGLAHWGKTRNDRLCSDPGSNRRKLFGRIITYRHRILIERQRHCQRVPRTILDAIIITKSLWSCWFLHLMVVWNWESGWFVDGWGTISLAYFVHHYVRDVYTLEVTDWRVLIWLRVLRSINFLKWRLVQHLYLSHKSIFGIFGEVLAAPLDLDTLLS